MDSTDIVNSIVLRQEDLPASVKEIFSRMEPGDKLTITAARFTLVENGEKIVHLAINEGDSITIKDPTNPEAEPVTFEMGEGDDEKTEPTDEEDEGAEKSPAVEAAKSAAEPDEEPPGEK